MQTMNISLPDALKAFVDAQVAGGQYSSVSEYVRELLRAAQVRESNARLARLLDDGLQSGAPMDESPEFWADVRRDVAARVAEHRATYRAR